MSGMGPARFRQLVGEVSGLGDENHFVRSAVEWEAEEHGALRPERVQAAADRAQESARGFSPVPRDEAPSGLRGRGLQLNAEAALISNALAKRLEPWARSVRERCFGCAAPPFRQWDEAVEWIESEVERNREAWVQSSASKVDAEADIRRLADLAGLEVKAEPRWLRYYKPGNEYTQLASAFPGTTIDELAQETNRVSEQTSFHPVVLTAFVLCGAAPAISRVRVTEVSKTCRVPGDRIPSRWVNVRFHAADVTDTELRGLYNDVRTFFGAKGSQRITWYEANFLSLVDDMGGPPASEKTRFWEDVLRRYKATRAATASPLNSWRAARNKYERLASRADISALTTPNLSPLPTHQER
jgi:hypothetical protein